MPVFPTFPGDTHNLDSALDGISLVARRHGTIANLLSHWKPRMSASGWESVGADDAGTARK